MPYYSFRSFDLKDNLNEDIWDENQHLYEEVRERLLTIALNFLKELGIPAELLENIVITGSMANYNWSSHSDIDLHLVVDYSRLNPDQDLVEDYFKAKKTVWNSEHDITVHGFEVEIYVEDLNRPAKSSAVYSVMYDEWVKKPNKIEATLDKETIGEKVDLINKHINHVEKLYRRDDYDDAIIMADHLLTKLKRMRKCGLEKGGEFSNENIAYKILRRYGKLQTLWDIKTEAYDKMMSLN